MDGAALKPWQQPMFRKAALLALIGLAWELYGRALDNEGIDWIEEPVRHDDFVASAALAREIATPVQSGATEWI